jgi:hypothetical protein
MPRICTICSQSSRESGTHAGGARRVHPPQCTRGLAETAGDELYLARLRGRFSDAALREWAWGELTSNRLLEWAVRELVGDNDPTVPTAKRTDNHG